MNIFNMPLEAGTPEKRTITLFKESKVWVNPTPTQHRAEWKVEFEGACSSDLNQVAGHHEMVSKEEDIPQEEEC
jgi:hypothetical protein